MIHLNVLDIIILLFCIYQGYKGYRSGAVSAIAPLIYWGLIFFGAVMLMRTIGDQVFARTLGFSSGISALLSFGIMVAIGFIFANKALGFAEGMIGGSLTKPNEIMGMIVGVLRGIFMLSLLFFAMQNFKIPSEKVRTSSLLYTEVRSFGERIWGFAEKLRPQTDTLADKFKNDVTTKPK